jgi:hypothetical protein
MVHVNSLSIMVQLIAMLRVKRTVVFQKVYTMIESTNVSMKINENMCSKQKITTTVTRYVALCSVTWSCTVSADRCCTTSQACALRFCLWVLLPSRKDKEALQTMFSTHIRNAYSTDSMYMVC